MGAVGLDAAAASQPDPRDAAAVDAAGWGRWKSVNGAAVAAHLAGGAVLTLANRRRISRQRGVFALSAAKAALTFGAVAATAYGEVLSRRARDAASGGGGVEGAPGSATASQALADAAKQRRTVRWAVTALTGGVVVTSALLGERQRPGRALRDIVRSLPEHLPSLAALPAVSDLPEQLKQLPGHLPRLVDALPDLRLPDVRLPEVHIPDVHLPDLHVPDLHLPDVHLPDVHLPEVRLPDLPSLPSARRLRRMAHRS